MAWERTPIQDIVFDVCERLSILERAVKEIQDAVHAVSESEDKE